MEIYRNEEILEAAFPNEIKKNEKLADKEFNTILKKVIVGKVLSVQGKVMILKKDMKRVYLAQKELTLFDGDSIVTHEKGRIQFRLNDESIMTLTPMSKLVLNRSEYDSEEKTRSFSLDLMLGKAGFLVKKLLHFKRSEFRVKISTAVCGVRGSDFVLRSTPKVTEVTTFEDTKLEVLSLATPGAKPTILESLERAVIEEGSIPSKVEKITPDEVEKIRKEFRIISNAVETEGMLEMRVKPSERLERKTTGLSPELPG